MWNHINGWLLSVITIIALSWGAVVWNTGDRLSTAIDGVSESLHKYAIQNNQRVTRNEKDIEFHQYSIEQHQRAIERLGNIHGGD